MNEKLTFSIIIPAWNGRAYLDDCLTAVLSQAGEGFEVIVVDNASTDGTADHVAAQYPAVRLIRHEQNRGFAGGCNAGLQAAQGRKLVLLNQDTQVAAGWLEALAQALDRPEIGAVGCKIVHADGRTIQHAGAWIEWPLGFAHHYGHGEAANDAWTEARAVECVTGAAVAFRREVLAEVGYLDEGFWPGYFEDMDFCLRLREAGYQIWYEPAAQLAHIESTSIRDPLQRSELYERGRLRFVLKHLPPARFLAEFVPAEEVYQMPAILGHGSRALRLAYLEAITASGSLLYQRWQAEPALINEVIQALRRLHQQAWVKDWQKMHETILDIEPVALPTDLSEWAPEWISHLEELELGSSLPIFGPLVARLRRLWYSVAARWGVRYLTQQQDTINQRQNLRLAALTYYIQTLERRIRDLADQNGLLAKKVAELNRRLEGGDDKTNDRKT
jgi:GT2 family glycosyltransferase